MNSEATKAAKELKVGYIRVSTVDQNTARQLDGMELDRVYVDKASGKDTSRPELQRLLNDAELLGALNAIVHVHSMDRLARSLVDLLGLVKGLTSKGIKLRFLKENLTFTGDDSAMSGLMLSIMGAVAEFERAMLKERQSEGIAKAKEAGKYKGSKPKLSPEQELELKARAAAGENRSSLAREYGISRPTLYSYING